MSLNIKGNVISSTDITSVGVFKTKVNRDGMLLYLDAGNQDSYPGTGTNWIDISGNGYTATMSNLTAANWVSVSGVMAFETNDTNNQGFRVSTFPSPQNGRTYELWYNAKSYAIGWQTWFDDGGIEQILFGTSTNTIYIYPTNNFTADLVAGTWYHIAYTMDNNKVDVAYKNGVNIGNGVYGGTLSGTGTLYLLGDAGSEITSGYCPIMRIYNRALSPFEIAENFQAERGRFSI